MPRYYPVDTGVDLEALPIRGDLLDAHWGVNGFSAVFPLADSGDALRVSFDRQCIVRILDEMALATEEEPTTDEGILPRRFAYRVEGANFAQAQSEGWKASNEASGRPVVHYRFETQWGCMDVLSIAVPAFEVVGNATADA